MIEFVPYKPEHLLKMDGCLINKTKSIDIDVAAELHAHFVAATVMNDGEPIACFGVHEVWGTNGEVWVALSEKVLEAHMKTLVVVTRRALDDMNKMYKRLQCYIEASNERALSFVEHFGFRCEGLLEAYGPQGEDFCVYARVAT